MKQSKKKIQAELWETDAVPMVPLTEQEEERLLRLTMERLSAQQRSMEQPAAKEAPHSLSSELSGGTVSMKMKKKKFTILAAAAALAVSSITVGATVYFHWDERLAEYLNADQSQQQLAQGAGAQVAQTVSDGGVSATVLQTLSDQYGMYILVEMTLPEGMAWQDNYTFERMDVVIPDAKYTGWSFQVLGKENNRVTLLFETNGDVDLNGKEISLNLQNISTAREGQFTPVIEGSWQFGWTAAFQDLSRKVDCSGVYIRESAGEDAPLYQVEQLLISPISLNLSVNSGPVRGPVTGTIQEDGTIILDWGTGSEVTAVPDTKTESVDGQELPDFFTYRVEGGEENSSTLVLTMKDGTQLRTEDQYMAVNGDGTGRIRWNFGQIVDPEQVESVTINGVTIPLDGEGE